MATRGLSYTVEETDFGILVRGTIPIQEVTALCRAWKKRGLTKLVPGVASALGALLAVASKENVSRWLEAVEHDAEKKAAGDRELAWLYGPDTGTSSLTIFYVLSRQYGGIARSRMHDTTGTPYDPDDFGRCYRLLKAIPEWRSQLGEVAACFPEWAGLVEAWDELERLFEEEVVDGSGRAPKLYTRMREIARTSR